MLLIAEALAVVAVVAGVIVLLRAMDISYYRGPIAIVMAALFATWLLRRRGESWSGIGMALPTRWKPAMMSRASWPKLYLTVCAAAPCGAYGG